MDKEYPSFTAAMAGVALFTVPMLWFFEWATWAWIATAVITVIGLWGWFQATMEVHRQRPESPPDVSDFLPHRSMSYGSDDEDLMESGRLLWQGHRQIRFAYQSFDSGDSDREVTVHKVVSKGRGNSSTYFKGFCHMRGEPRTFRLDRIKGKVIDTSTGEMATFRQLFELSSR